MSSDPLRMLLEAAREGDDVALHRLVVETQQAVHRLCSALGTPGSTEDLVQDTYLRAIQAAPAYRGEAPVLAWLLAIARRSCADDVRRRQRARRLNERLSRERTRGSVAAPGDPVDDLMAVLDPDRREALVLTQYVGLSYDDAAHVIGCPVGTVRSRVARAREDLMRQLREAEAR